MTSGKQGGGEEPGWDELPVLEGERGRPAENLPLFEPSDSDAESPHQAAARSRPRRSDAARAVPAKDDGAAAPAAAPQWVQAALDQPHAEHRAPGPEHDAALGGLDDQPSPRAAGAAAPLLERLLAAFADLVLHLAVLASVLVAESLLGLQPAPDQWPGFVGFLLCFSFLYTTVPLAFWGQTPGMAWRGLRARDLGDRPLAFGQTALRWLGSLVTAALLGLPGLLALGGRSLADRLSGSQTFGEAR